MRFAQIRAFWLGEGRE